jgi:hypothetical protein
VEVQGSHTRSLMPEATIKLPVTDLSRGNSVSATKDAACDCEVRKSSEEESRKPFDLRRGPLHRMSMREGMLSQSSTCEK